jgi:hypothetical protein
MIILTENTIISEVNNDGEDISDYSKQLCRHILYNYSRSKKEERWCNYSNTKYNYFSY